MTPGIEDCRKAIIKFQTDQLADDLSGNELYKLQERGLVYLSAFSELKDCYNKDAGECADILTRVAESSGQVRNPSMALAPVTGLVIDFNVAIVSETTRSMTSNVSAALYPNVRIFDWGSGVTVFQSPTGSLRIAQGMQSKLIRDCGDGLLCGQ